MKKFGRIISIAALVLAVAAVAVVASACGGYAEGNYKGEYSYTVGETTYTYTVTFTVNDKGLIWDTVITPGTGAPGIGQRPWDGTKVTGGIDGKWTPSEIAAIEVKVDENGAPTGDIVSDRDFPFNVGYEKGGAGAILAMQNALENGPLAEEAAAE